ncbi:hypothetical protein CTA2_317 [Colletotrichum tanaceti]|nr:hypothetical protein CTA2_317 [Colletotrichum tanaceti]
MKARRTPLLITAEYTQRHDHTIHRSDPHDLGYEGDQVNPDVRARRCCCTALPTQCTTHVDSCCRRRSRSLLDPPPGPRGRPEQGCHASTCKGWRVSAAQDVLNFRHHVQQLHRAQHPLPAVHEPTATPVAGKRGPPPPPPWRRVGLRIRSGVVSPVRPGREEEGRSQPANSDLLFGAGMMNAAKCLWSMIIFQVTCMLPPNELRACAGRTRKLSRRRLFTRRFGDGRARRATCRWYIL